MINQWKIRITSKSHSKMVQKELFSKGFVWHGDDKGTVQQTQAEWIFGETDTTETVRRLSYSDDFLWGERESSFEVKYLLPEQRTFLERIKNTLTISELKFTEKSLVEGFYFVKYQFKLNQMIAATKRRIH